MDRDGYEISTFSTANPSDVESYFVADDPDFFKEPELTPSSRLCLAILLRAYVDLELPKWRASAYKWIFDKEYSDSCRVPLPVVSSATGIPVAVIRERATRILDGEISVRKLSNDD